MRFTQRVTVIGMKSSKGALENGTPFDSTKIFVLIDLDSSKGRMKGQAVQDYKIGDAAEYDKYSHLPFPVTCDAEFELSSSGTQQRMTVVGLKPVDMAKPAARG